LAQNQLITQRLDALAKKIEKIPQLLSVQATQQVFNYAICGGVILLISAT